MKTGKPTPPESDNNADGSVSLCETKTSGFHAVSGPSVKVELRQSTIHGYGVFAKETIGKGELIEEARLLALQFRSKYPQDRVLRDYVWTDQSCACNECRKYGFRQYMALGFGSLYNHSDHPNTIQDLNFRTERMSIVARETILEGEEICVAYGELYWVLKKFWKDLPDEVVDRLIERVDKKASH